MNLFLVRVQYFLSNFFVLELLTSFCVGLRKKTKNAPAVGPTVVGYESRKGEKIGHF